VTCALIECKQGDIVVECLHLL